MGKSFQNAFRGFHAAVKKERNLRFHLVFAFYVVLAAVITGLEPVEWCIIALCIAAVISAELLNTALERLCDVVSAKQSEQIKLVKDIAAGAVLVSALISIFVGGVIFINPDKLLRVSDYARNNPVMAAVIIGSIPAGAYSIIGRK